MSWAFCVSENIFDHISWILCFLFISVTPMSFWSSGPIMMMMLFPSLTCLTDLMCCLYWKRMPGIIVLSRCFLAVRISSRLGSLIIGCLMWIQIVIRHFITLDLSPTELRLNWASTIHIGRWSQILTCILGVGHWKVVWPRVNAMIAVLWDTRRVV